MKLFARVTDFNLLSKIALQGKLNWLQTFYDYCAFGLKDIGKVICGEPLADLKNIQSRRFVAAVREHGKCQVTACNIQNKNQQITEFTAANR